MNLGKAAAEWRAAILDASAGKEGVAQDEEWIQWVVDGVGQGSTASGRKYRFDKTSDEQQTDKLDLRGVKS